MMSPSGLGLRFVTLDVFSSQRFRGNQLAVVQVPKNKSLTQEQKQEIAIEFNFSETVFLHEADPNATDPTWVVDIFTIEQELNFAGHPTIGSACYLGSIHPGLKKGNLKTRAGPIPFKINVAADGGLSATEAVPHNIHVHQNRVSREQFLSFQPGLANEPSLPESFPVVSCVDGMNFALLELDSLEALSKVTTSAATLKDVVKLDDGWSTGNYSSYHYVIDRQRSSQGKIRLRTRNVDGPLEDAATGSAASALAAYLALEMAKLGPSKEQSLELEIEQGVEMGRASKIHVKVDLTADHRIDNIFLSGDSVVVMSGELL